MADPSLAWPDNAATPSTVDGQRVRFYVDQACILCAVCSDLAPDNFAMANTEDHDVCFHQPTTSAQLERCQLALGECPVEAIGCEVG